MSQAHMAKLPLIPNIYSCIQHMGNVYWPVMSGQRIALTETITVMTKAVAQRINH